MAAAATSAAAPAATRQARGGGHRTARAPDTDHGQATRHALTRTPGTHHRGLGTLDILLELPLTLIATVLVDRHLGSWSDPTVTGRLAGRSSSRTPRRSPRGYRRFHPGGCPDPP